MDTYDVLVIGGGAAGMSAAKTARGTGKKTAIIEKDKLGGDCTWLGCIPSKALIRAANAVKQAQSLNAFSIASKAPLDLDTNHVLDYTRKIVAGVYEGSNPGIFEELGIPVLSGSPEFSDEHTIRIKGEVIRASKIIICTGSSPLIPKIRGIENTQILTNTNIFERKTLPASLLVLGGGPIGLELAQAFSRLGVKVTVVEMMQTILPREDSELVNMLESILKDEGIEFLTGTKATSIEGNHGDIRLTIENANKTEQVLHGSEILVATGRSPNTSGMGLAELGVKIAGQGIAVDSYLRTSLPHIYAAGDVTGPFLFSHMAGYQGVAAGLNASLPFKRKVNYDGALWAYFTDPELARFGLTEAEAKDRYGDKVRVYRVPYSALDRAKTDSTTTGLAKFVLDKKGKLLGAHILGYMAGELLHEAQLLRSLGLPLSIAQSVIHAYPTYSDITRLAANKAKLDEVLGNPFVKVFLRLFSKKGNRNK